MQKEADENNSAGFFKSLKEVDGPQAKMSNILLSRDSSTVHIFFIARKSSSLVLCTQLSLMQPPDQERDVR